MGKVRYVRISKEDTGVKGMEDVLRKVLVELEPYVIIVGSYARGDNHSGSDIDMYIRKRRDKEFEDDWYGELDESYITEVIDVLKKYNVHWDSLISQYIHTTSLPVQIELSSIFKISKNELLKRVTIFGVSMVAARDDKNLKSEDVNYDL